MSEQKQKSFMTRFLCGILMGFGFIVPGVSGSAIAIMFGIYEELVSSVSDILSKFKKSVAFLFPVALGVVVSVAALFYPLLWALEKNCFVVIMLFAGLLIGALKPMLKEVKWKSAPKSHYALFAVSFLVIDYIKNKSAKREKEKNIVFVSAEYDTIRGEVENICGLLGIHNVKFDVIDEKRTNAYSRMNEDGVWEVVVTSQFISKLRIMLQEDKNNEKKVVLSIEEVKRIFLVTVAHELGHVFYKDTILEKRRILLSVFVSFGILIMAMFLLVFSVKSLFLVVVSSILLLGEWIFGSIMCDSRYWGQIAEFKADRIVAKYVEGGTEAFVYFWGNDKKIQLEEESTQNIIKENWIYKYYKRNLEVEKHPSWKYRRKLMEERKEWKWWEYFEHALVIRKWRRKGLGWYGVLKVIGI